MKTKKILFVGSIIISLFFTGGVRAESKIVYPLSQISKLECRFEKFNELGSNCKTSIPLLLTKDYKKYATENGGYNDYTRTYTVLWGGSYKYGWDVGNGGHLGVDIATAEGTPVQSIADGEVILAGNQIGRGNVISIEHKINGKVVISNYAHLSKILVQEGDSIDSGEKIGEVGSTGNSTGNHLHFQIDLQYMFHPYYYDYATCPYTSNEITESGICFNDLVSHTIDPLLFLETAGAVLDTISVKSVDISSDTKQKTLTTYSTSLSGGGSILASFDDSIFSRTVYIGSSNSDVKLVQQIFKSLGVYSGDISGDYNDVINSIITYQLSKHIIASKNDEGAGYFGPKTRAQTKIDYEALTLAGGKISNIKDIIVSTMNTTQKIEKAGLITREEREEREIKDFFRNYDISLTFENAGGNVAVGDTITLNLVINDKKGRPFKGNTPGELNFVIDREKVDVFPNKLYYFSDGKREIKLTGVSTGSTKLSVKIGNTEIKHFDIKVFDGKLKIYGSAAKIISNSRVVIGEQKHGMLVMQDENKVNMINLKYVGSYTLSSSDDVLFCLKKGNLADVRKIYNSSCASERFTNEITFNYDDTIGGLLIFDYKILGKDAKIKLSSVQGNKTLGQKEIVANAPKGLAKNYEYYDDVIKLLSMGVVDGVNKGDFLEDRGLTEMSALTWIKNMLIVMQENTSDKEIIKKIDIKLSLLDEEEVSKFSYINRKDFLDNVYTYLVFDDTSQITINYKDLDSTSNKKANTIFDAKNTWKDQFGQKYYRPDKSLTRGEGAYLLSTLLEKSEKTFVTFK